MPSPRCLGVESGTGGRISEVTMGSSLWLLFFLWAGFMTGHACANDIFGRGQ